MLYTKQIWQPEGHHRQVENVKLKSIYKTVSGIPQIAIRQSTLACDDRKAKLGVIAKEQKIKNFSSMQVGFQRMEEAKIEIIVHIAINNNKSVQKFLTSSRRETMFQKMN